MATLKDGPSGGLLRSTRSRRPSDHIASVAAFLIRQERACIGCAAVTCVLSLDEATAAVNHLAKNRAVEQHMGRCGVCGRAQPVVNVLRH